MNFFLSVFYSYPLTAKPKLYLGVRPKRGFSVGGGGCLVGVGNYFAGQVTLGL